MSQRIYRELTDDFIRRMRNWRRWWDTSQGAIYPSSLATAGIESSGDRYREATEPLLFGEARDTEVALRAIPIKYQHVVRQFWLYEGRSLRSHARGKGIDYHTLETWVLQGHELLKAELRRMTAIWESRQAEMRARHASP
jgi:hypothetical protein